MTFLIDRSECLFIASVITVVQIINDRDTYQCRCNQCFAVTHVLNREVILNTLTAGIFLYQDLGKTGSELLVFYFHGNRYM